MALAQRVGGRRQPGSGNQWHSRGDVKVGNEWLWEAKFTDAPIFSVTSALLQKIQSEAYLARCEFWGVEVWFRGEDVRLMVLCSEYVENRWNAGWFGSLEETKILEDTLSFRIRPWFRPELFSAYVFPWGRVFLCGKGVFQAMQDHKPTTVDVGGVLYSLLSDENNKPSNRSLGCIGGSSLHQCRRRSFYRLTHVEPKPCWTPEQLMVFHIGSWVHDGLQTKLKALLGGILQCEVRVENAEYSFQGSADGVLRLTPGVEIAWPESWVGDQTLGWVDGLYETLTAGNSILLEIKTCSSLPNQPSPEHMMQAVSYAHFLGLSHLCFLYVKKSDGSFVSFTVPAKQPAVLREVLERLQYLRSKKERGEPPPQEISHECRSCEYQWTCQPKKVSHATEST